MTEYIARYSSSPDGENWEQISFESPDLITAGDDAEAIRLSDEYLEDLPDILDREGHYYRRDALYRLTAVPDSESKTVRDVLGAGD